MYFLSKLNLKAHLIEVLACGLWIYLFDIFKLFTVYYNILSSCVDIRTTFHVCYVMQQQINYMYTKI